ncbi:MAG: 16S rRNA (guanine(527)-N(7))-methyltransferase RsmG [Bacillota bacterium]|nr:16S rRNA (guanine(527)-N(7))-methyltransferase RsmG [Bacillota bacterium]
MHEAFAESLLEGARQVGVAISAAQADLMARHARHVLDNNVQAGLTEITGTEAMAIKHYVDSLTCLHLVKAGESLVDVGAGAGFPGIPLKIMEPSIHLTLLESSVKKARFLEDTLAHIGLPGRVVNMRTEDYGRDAGRESFDVAVARAVAKMRVLSEYCLGLVRVGGLFIAMKGPAPHQEVSEATRAMRLMGGRLQGIETLDLPSGYGARSLVLVRKVSPSSSGYPRNAGMATKNPL